MLKYNSVMVDVAAANAAQRLSASVEELKRGMSMIQKENRILKTRMELLSQEYSKQNNTSPEIIAKWELMQVIEYMRESIIVRMEVATLYMPDLKVIVAAQEHASEVCHQECKRDFFCGTEKVCRKLIALFEENVRYFLPPTPTQVRRVVDVY